MPRIPKNITGKEYKRRFRGMKKCPPSVLQVSKDAQINKVRAKRHAEMKKVKSNETIETWARRVRKYNLVSEEAIQRKIDAKKYQFKAVVRSKEVQRKKMNQKNRTISVEFKEKDHDFLKYYGIIINYYSVKYGIRKGDLEICFAFYNNKIIDVDRFYNICILNYGSSAGVLPRFKKNGYLSEIINTIEFEKKTSKRVRTNTFKLSLSMMKLISHIYEKIAKLNTLNKHQYRGMYSPECEKEIIVMNEEIQDYITANKQQLNINQIK